MGLYMRNRPIDSKRVPIALLSKVFARFEVNFHEGCEAPYGLKEFEAARELMYGLAYPHDTEGGGCRHSSMDGSTSTSL